MLLEEAVMSMLLGMYLLVGLYICIYGSDYKTLLEGIDKFDKFEGWLLRVIILVFWPFRTLIRTRILMIMSNHYQKKDQESQDR
jgi:hypothetical protein